MADVYLTEHFKLSEVACHCGCGYADVSPTLLRKLERMRELAGGLPLPLSSVCRCPAHNRACGGADDSRHVMGQAGDIPCHDSGRRYRLVQAAIEVGFGGIGIGTKPGKAIIHVDERPISQRCIWVY